MTDKALESITDNLDADIAERVYAEVYGARIRFTPDQRAAWRQSQREPLPAGRRVTPLHEAISNFRDVKRGPARPLDGTVTMQNGDVLRYWSDGSLRHEGD